MSLGSKQPWGIPGSTDAPPSGGGGGGVDSVSAGTKITVTGTATDPIVNNDGVRSVAAGNAGITVAGTPHDPTVANAGVLGVGAGAGIGLSGTAQNPIVDNDGVLDVAAGTNVTIGGTAQHPIINASGGGNINSVTMTSPLFDAGTPTDPNVSLFGGTLNFLCPYPDPGGTAAPPNPPLPDADTTLFVADDASNADATHASIFHDGGPLTADRTYTLSPTGALTKEQLLIDIQGFGSLDHNITIVNGGLLGGTLYTFAAGQINRYLATFQFDGVNWALDSIRRITW